MEVVWEGRVALLCGHLLCHPRRVWSLEWVLCGKPLGPLAPSPSLLGPRSLSGLFYQSPPTHTQEIGGNLTGMVPGGRITKGPQGVGHPRWAVQDPGL